MNKGILVACAVVDGLLLYGACRLFGFKPNGAIVALVIAGLYAAMDYKLNRKKGA